MSAVIKEDRRRLRVVAIGLGGLLAISFVQKVARFPTQDLTSSGTWSIAVAWSIPILLAALGGMYAERSGIVNIGLEGMMVLGTWFGAMFTILAGPWWGMLAAGVAGALGGLVMAVATVSFKVDHVIAGVALNLMAPGITRFLSDVHFSDRGGSITQSPTIVGVSRFSLPFLAGGQLFGWKSPDILGAVEDAGVIVVSDLGGIVRGFASNMSWMTLVAILMVPATVWLLWKTPFGLRLRSCGEHPDGADSLGVNVYLYKYYGVLASGFLAGLGGGFLAVELSGLYKEGQNQNKGFIGLATLIFGNWRPVATALGSLLFGFTETLRLRDQDAPHALLLLVVVALAVLAVRAAAKRQLPAVAVSVLVMTVIGYAYLTTGGVPDQLPKITPYLTVLAVLLFGTTRLRPPAAESLPWSKGEH
jgi:simple sugar transport system permease protein